jgi:hypothetical protein
MIKSIRKGLISIGQKYSDAKKQARILARCNKGAFGGKVNTKMIETAFLVFILVTVLFESVGTLFPTLQTAGNTLNASGMPLGSFFASGGVVYLLMAAGLIILIVRTFMTGKR